jgi:hypothetical protein
MQMDNPKDYEKKIKPGPKLRRPGGATHPKTPKYYNFSFFIEVIGRSVCFVLLENPIGAVPMACSILIE